MRWLYRCEIFHVQDSVADTDAHFDPHPDGWYFWVRRPGGLPETYASGPFPTFWEAAGAIQDNADGFEADEVSGRDSG